ncbi:hypothetical protein EB796_008078 [Bugula neritina]|uniref:Uncharacterized protein n=1 Tax=Bugula neritina TaxID=10212 RepID=A0A7J7K7L7_BUGNE|nr:hypothetical protein EB796_008078 [Bugula neritina]
MLCNQYSVLPIFCLNNFLPLAANKNDESALASSNTLDTQANLVIFLEMLLSFCSVKVTFIISGASSNTETSSSLCNLKAENKAPKTGTRTGLRSQSNISLEPQSTALASPTERAAERTSSTSSASTSRAAPTTSHVPATTSRATSRLSSSTSQALTSTASRRLTSAVASSTSASGSGSEPASRHSTRSRAAAAPKSAASLASSSSGESSRSSNITHSAADKSKGKERKARTTGTGGPSHSHPKLAGVRRATKVATTGDTNSKVKRTPGGVGSAHGERGESAAALPRLSQRNSAAT